MTLSSSTAATQRPDLTFKILNEIKKIEASLADDTESKIRNGTLRHLLKAVATPDLDQDVKSRAIEAVAKYYDSRNPSFKSYFNILDRAENLKTFGSFSHTSVIAKEMQAAKMTSAKMTSNQQAPYSMDGLESWNTHECPGEVMSDGHIGHIGHIETQSQISSSDHSTAFLSCASHHSYASYHSCTSTPLDEEEADSEVHIKQGPVRAQLDALISQLESAFSDRPVSAEHVSQALESLLFPFMTHINPQGQNSDPCTLIVEEYRTTTPSFSIKLQSTAAVIGEVATKSRVPFDFYLSPQMSLNIEAYSDTPGIEKGISIHFGSEDFRLLRLTPKKSMAICNSFPWAARLFNAVEESVTGLNLVMPVQVNGLDFTEQGHVAMRDEDLAPTGWSTADVEHSKSEALTFLQTVAPKEALANRFAKSAWTMGCIRQKPDEYCGAGFPKARSVNFLNVIRDTSVHVNDDPGRMTWRGMGDISLAQHMLSVDQHWSPHGKKGDVILSVHKGKATVLCK